MYRSLWVLALWSAASLCSAGDDTVKAAVGGGAGGAIGAAVGQELGDRNGAIVGAAIGGALGAAIATDDQAPAREAPVRVEVGVSPRAHPPRHCPPGQHKKGRC